MRGRPLSPTLPSLTPDETQVKTRLAEHVRVLAGEIGERNVWRPEALSASAHYISTTLRGAQYDVASQSFRVWRRTVSNIAAELRGHSRSDEIIVVGAHYDTVAGCPGANDNATGVAAMLEIARLVRDARPARTVRSVAFVNEEPPFFRTPAMGSHVYARHARRLGEKIAAMLSLETMGCYLDAPGTQRYPPPFGWFYPDTGNFIALVGNLASRRLLGEVTRSFRRHAAVPVEAVAAPGWITGLGWSDHWSFWKHGYPAVMVTDTALFRYPHYHTAEDTADKIDFERLARVVAGLARVVIDLAG